VSLFYQAGCQDPRRLRAFRLAKGYDVRLSDSPKETVLNLEKVIFGFFVILACTLNAGFFIGEIDVIYAHNATELFAVLVVNIVVLILKIGDRTQIGALQLATSLAAVLQLILSCLVWLWQVQISGAPMDAPTMATIVSLAGGALLANVISVILLIGETLRHTR
jgi:hypothetical protein